MIRYTQKGFTLVESLVALAIFLIATVGPMYAVSQALSIASIARDRTIARFLAQEGVELVRYYRDNVALRNQISPGEDWLNVLRTSLSPTSICLSTYGCYASSVDVPQACSSGGCPPLKISGSTGRYQYLTGTDTKFVRTITITEVSSGQAQVQVAVEWRPKVFLPTRSVAVETWMYDWTDGIKLR